MPNRKYGNLMQHRQYIASTSRLYDALYGSKIFHVDAWIYQTNDDVLYLLLESRAGGQQLLDRAIYRMEPGTLTPVGDMPLEDIGVRRHCDGPWARRNAPWLADLHWRYIQPQMRLPRVGYNRVCVKLWYVWSDPSVVDPFAGVTNMYAATGRAARDDAMRSPGKHFDATVREFAQLWDAADRSRLRTLDKLLK